MMAEVSCPTTNGSKVRDEGAIRTLEGPLKQQET